MPVPGTASMPARKGSVDAFLSGPAWVSDRNAITGGVPLSVNSTFTGRPSRPSMSTALTETACLPTATPSRSKAKEPVLGTSTAWPASIRYLTADTPSSSRALPDILSLPEEAAFAAGLARVTTGRSAALSTLMGALIAVTLPALSLAVTTKGTFSDLPAGALSLTEKKGLPGWNSSVPDWSEPNFHEISVRPTVSCALKAAWKEPFTAASSLGERSSTTGLVLSTKRRKGEMPVEPVRSTLLNQITKGPSSRFDVSSWNSKVKPSLALVGLKESFSKVAPLSVE